MHPTNFLQWLDEQIEHISQNRSNTDIEDHDVELGGFGFPHYAEFDNPSTNHFLHL